MKASGAFTVPTSMSVITNPCGTWRPETAQPASHPQSTNSDPPWSKRYADTPALTGDRTARIAARIEELGPTLVETVRRRDTLPRIAQAVVVAATRNYGVPDNETDLLR